MAQCEFAGGIENVRGTLSKTVFFDKGKKITRLITASVRGGKQRLYIRDRQERSTPVTQKEIIVRTQFKAATAFVNSLTPEQKKSYYDEWKRSKFMFNGKKYKTLRGFIMARFFAGAVGEK